MSEYGMNYTGLCSEVYEKTVRTETTFIIYGLTFIHTYFLKIFCQKNVIKNSKQVVRVFSENADIGSMEECGMLTIVLRERFTVCGSVNSLSNNPA